MKLNTIQVAEKAGISRETVLRLRDSGKLTDVAVRKDGKKKHYSLFESAQVNDYIKEFGRGNGRRKPTTPPVSANGPALLSRIDSRLSNLEDKMEQLLRAWS